MKTNIEQIRDQIEETNQEIAFIQNFEKPFLESEWAPYYLWHENGQLYEWERVVRLRSRWPLDRIEDNSSTVPDEIRAMQQDDVDISITTPQESRHYFIQDKLQPVQEWWLFD